MMKILNIKEELSALFTKDIPIQASWKISKFVRQIETEHADFEVNRMKILEKHVDKEKGKVPEDKLDAFKKDMEDLLAVEVELEVTPIDIKELGNISVPPLALARMAFLFTETEEADSEEGEPEESDSNI